MSLVIGRLLDLLLFYESRIIDVDTHTQYTDNNPQNMVIMSNPVCAYSLVKEGTPDEFLNYDGSSLQRCSRCKGVW